MSVCIAYCNYHNYNINSTKFESSWNLAQEYADRHTTAKYCLPLGTNLFVVNLSPTPSLALWSWS